MKVNAFDPAFARSAFDSQQLYSHATDGLTKREYIATHCMAGILQRGITGPAAARQALEAADALIEVLSQ